MQTFLSHSSSDAPIAGSVKRLIEQCSLGSASVWFSSDMTASGGMTPGGPWFDQLVDRLGSCSAFVALITPRSADNLWLHYEAGCAATKRVPIVPIAIGIPVSQIALPLAMYNVHAISKPADLKTCLMRLYHLLNIPHDEAMLETPVQKTFLEIMQVDNREREANPSSLDTNLNQVTRLIDQRFMELFGKLSLSVAGPAESPVYSIPVVLIDEDAEIDRFYLDMSEADSLQDVANACYFKISHHVSIYSYLVEWIIRDKTLGVDLVCLDVAPHIKASAVIRPGHEYQAILLKKPFDPRKYSGGGRIRNSVA